MEISLAALLEIPSVSKVYISIIFHAANLSDVVFTRRCFLPGDLVIGLGGLAKALDVVWTFLVGEYTRFVSAKWVSLISLPLHFLKEPCLSPDLSS